MKRRSLVIGVLAGTAIICGLLVTWNFVRDYMIASYFANMPRPAQTVSSAEVKVKDWAPGIAAIGTSRAANGVDHAVRGSRMGEALLVPEVPGAKAEDQGS